MHIINSYCQFDRLELGRGDDYALFELLPNFGMHKIQGGQNKSHIPNWKQTAIAIKMCSE